MKEETITLLLIKKINFEFIYEMLQVRERHTNQEMDTGQLSFTPCVDTFFCFSAGAFLNTRPLGPQVRVKCAFCSDCRLLLTDHLSRLVGVENVLYNIFNAHGFLPVPNSRDSFPSSPCLRRCIRLTRSLSDGSVKGQYTTKRLGGSIPFPMVFV